MWKPIDKNTPKDRRILLYYSAPVFTELSILIGHWDDDTYATHPKPHWTHDLKYLSGVKTTRENQPVAWMELPVYRTGNHFECPTCGQDTYGIDFH